MARHLTDPGVIPWGHDPAVEQPALVIQIADPPMPPGNKRHLDQMTASLGISDPSPKATRLLRALDSPDKALVPQSDSLAVSDHVFRSVRFRWHGAFNFCGSLLFRGLCLLLRNRHGARLMSWGRWVLKSLACCSLKGA